MALQESVRSGRPLPDGITWVPLAPLRDPGSSSRDRPDAGDTRAVRARRLRCHRERLRGKQVSLLLDNAEHLLCRSSRTTSPPCSEHARRSAFRHRSRERIQIGGEASWAADARRERGQELFVERAAPPASSSGSTTRFASSAALDELPLAIGLAAARTPLFGAEGLLERVGSRLDLLRGLATATRGRPLRDHYRLVELARRSRDASSSRAGCGVRRRLSLRRRAGGWTPRPTRCSR